MAQYYSTVPTFEQSLIQGKTTNKNWYFFWQGLSNGIPPGAESVVAPGASPYEFAAPSGGFLIIQGGTVSFVSFSRDHTTFYATGQTQGMFPVSQGDILLITYSVAPNLTFVPQ